MKLFLRIRLDFFRHLFLGLACVDLGVDNLAESRDEHTL